MSLSLRPNLADPWQWGLLRRPGISAGMTQTSPGMASWRAGIIGIGGRRKHRARANKTTRRKFKSWCIRQSIDLNASPPAT